MKEKYTARAAEEREFYKVKMDVGGLRSPFPLKKSRDLYPQFHRFSHFYFSITDQGRSQDFSKGGGHTVSNIIVMAFSPRNIVGCLLKKGLQRGGHGHPRTPALATTLLTVFSRRYKEKNPMSRYIITVRL